mgnify:CR=1 FL=1
MPDAIQPDTTLQPVTTFVPYPTAHASGVHHFDPWRQPWHSAPVNPSFCDYALWRTSPGGYAVLLVSERPDNDGMSVTNAIEHIVTGLVVQLGLTLAKTTVVEHYYFVPGRYCCDDHPETFDLVALLPNPHAFSGFNAPAWRRIARADVEAMIGGAL